MDPGEIDALVQRLVANPHDEEALAYAHQAGAADPKSYAFMLEKVGHETTDAAYASHWLSEAANVWSTTLGDAHHAAHLLKLAVDKDPTQHVAAERLAQLYRDKGDVRALIALLAHRARAMTPLLAGKPELRAEVAGLNEELGRLWSDPAVAQPKKAIEHYRRAIELDPQSAFAIYSVRELYKSQQQWAEALQMYEMELAIEPDQGRRVALLRDEAATRRTAGDLPGATQALAMAQQIDERDPAVQQELAATVLDRLAQGEPVPAPERTLAAGLLVALAESYDGDHGLAYAGGALDAEPGNDRGMQLYAHYARALQKEDDVSSRYLAYLEANPQGAMADEARQMLAASYEAAGQHDNARRILEGGPVGGGRAGARVPVDTRYDQAGSEDNRVTGRPPLPPGMPPQPPTQRAGRPPPPTPVERIQSTLEAAQLLVGKNKKAEALAKYKEVLEADASHPEALAWVEDYLRTKRDFAQLRDVLLASTRALTGKDTLDTRRERLREVAGLCEGNLRDVDGAVGAWRQLLAIDRGDDAARQALTRLLEKSQRWDELANLYEQEATVESDVEAKIQLEKKLAGLHENKRKDLGAAAEAWQRIADLAPEDDHAVSTASKLFEKAGRLDQAAQVLSDHASHLEDVAVKGPLLERLGELREQLRDPGAAGDAFAEAAGATQNPKHWEAAERNFAAAERWDVAANAASQRAELAVEPKAKAQHFARAAGLLVRAQDDDGAQEKLEQATDLDPASDEYAQALADRLSAGEKWDALADAHAKRGDRLSDKGARIVERKKAAIVLRDKLQDKERAREQWLKVLEDGDDREALEQLVEDAIARADHEDATALLRRLGATTQDKGERARLALREAELLAEGVGDVDMAIARYESVLSDLDPTCRPALQAIADLQEARDNHAAAAEALERELKLVTVGSERGQIALRLGAIYEQQLDDPRKAIGALDIVRKEDPEDFDALTRLCVLCEKVEDWPRVADLLAQRIEVEGDEQESSVMTRKLAGILETKLDRGDEALAALTELADQGDEAVRAAYVELGDRLGWKGIVASKLVEWWFEARPGAERTAALRTAFDRFADVGRDQDATRVGVEIIRAKGADPALASRLEDLSVKVSDHEALSIAHDLLSRELAGAERAQELVRQAEVRVKAGMPAAEAIQHGESGLTSVPAGEVEPLLERLAELAASPGDVVDLYERQVTRCKAAQDRVRALARAAQVAVARGQVERARGFFDLALAAAPTDDVLRMLEDAARAGDESAGGELLRRTLGAALAAGGQGARDGGRSRGMLLRRAASLIRRELGDVDQAFLWLGDALIAHVDPSTLDELEELTVEIGEPKRAEETITRALSEVFDGPLVRQLLGRRAKLRRERMEDPQGAAADLKKLHDLSPTDQAVMDELSALLLSLGDYRGMVQLFEDQILRGKDQTARAELARKVARMWEEQLQDPREAADAWRRVLRMRSGDPEATAGLERAKTNMLKKPDPNAPPPFVPAPKPAPTPAPAPVAKARPAPSPEPSNGTTLESPTAHDEVVGDDDFAEELVTGTEAQYEDPSLTAAVPARRDDRPTPHTSPDPADETSRFLEDELLDSGETTAEKQAPAASMMAPLPFDDQTVVPGVSTRRSPTSVRPMSTKPPPLPPPPTQPTPKHLPDYGDALAKTGEGEASTPLSSTNETPTAAPGELDFPEETSIGTRPVFGAQAPLYEEHTVITHEDEAPADRSSEAIMVADDEIEEEPQTVEGNAIPRRSVPPPFPRS